MDAMSSRISENLRQIRKEKKLSLDSMAEQTGVSKSMLGQIERGESSPTVATLWKIATGLHISFTALLDGTEEFVLVFEGALRLTVDGVEYVVEAGEGIRYLANKPHIYECHGTQKTKICMVIYYDK